MVPFESPEEAESNGITFTTCCHTRLRPEFHQTPTTHSGLNPNAYLRKVPAFFHIQSHLPFPRVPIQSEDVRYDTITARTSLTLSLLFIESSYNTHVKFFPLIQHVYDITYCCNVLQQPEGAHESYVYAHLLIVLISLLLIISPPSLAPLPVITLHPPYLQDPTLSGY